MLCLKIDEDRRAWMIVPPRTPTYCLNIGKKLFSEREEKGMSDYCTCSDCEYCDPNETKGYKEYCEWYGTYEDPDKVRECPHYKPR